MNKTKIEYLTHTWNPIVMRCSRVSESCEGCWHLQRADMLAKNPKVPPHLQKIYAGEAPFDLITERLLAPWPLKKPARIGVQFMGDLFHDKITLGQVLAIMEIIKVCEHHTFLILTKRPDSMLTAFFGLLSERIMPLPKNLWLGVTVENSDYLKRIDDLRATSAKLKFISFEPLLGPIVDVNLESIDWVIAGCESGPKRRPSKYHWFRDLRSQCVAAGVPFFLKQMEIDGKITKMPELDGRVWDQMPGG